ncbi:MAG: CRISPR-associated endonuclease Cas2 [Bacteroidia bacterium]
MNTRLNAYRIMWTICFFDLPVKTKKEQKIANNFRKFLKDDGFMMLQFSVYGRHCPSSDNANVHINRIKKHIPQHGSVLILKITDKQFGEAIIYHNAKKEDPPKGWQQLELF